jgi:hypothetical protein
MVCQSPVTRESSLRSISAVYKDSKCSNALEEDGDNNDCTRLKYHNKKRLRKRLSVSFDDRRNTIVSIPSIDDLTREELAAYFYQRWEYISMKDSMKQTIDLLKVQSYGTAFILDHSDQLCVRGLEWLADNNVSMHRKRVRRMSTSAVLMQQNLNRTCEYHGESAHCGTERVARAYQVYSESCQAIANRWGLFDAVDAGTPIELNLCDDEMMVDI